MSPGLRMVRQAVAVALLSALGAVLAAPLLQPGDVEGPYCAGDRCCCAPDAAEGRACFRSICRCGTESGVPALVSLGEGVLPSSVLAPRLQARRAAPRRGLPLPAVPDLIPPDHPPPAA